MREIIVLHVRHAFDTILRRSNNRYMTIYKKNYLLVHFVLRDFVNLRRWERRGDVFVSCNSTIVLDELPPKTDHVR